MNDEKTGTSRWAMSRDEIVAYAVIMLVALVAPLTGLTLVFDFVGLTIDVMALLWLPVGLTLALAYLVQRRRRTVLDDLSDQFYDR